MPLIPPHPPFPPRPPEPRPSIIIRQHTITRSYDDSISAQVQGKLKKLGYYNGSVDGEIGPKTRDAIRAYQEENGLEITGRIDKALLSSLAL